MFDDLSEIRTEMELAETKAKEVARAMVKEGDEKGVRIVYDSEDFVVKVTVKYGSGELDLDTIRQLYPDVADRVIATAEMVNLEALQREIDNDRAPTDVLELIEPGEFLTPSVTIKPKIKRSIVIE